MSSSAGGFVRSCRHGAPPATPAITAALVSLLLCHEPAQCLGALRARPESASDDVRLALLSMAVDAQADGELSLALALTTASLSVQAVVR